MLGCVQSDWGKDEVETGLADGRQYRVDSVHYACGFVVDAGRDFQKF